VRCSCRKELSGRFEQNMGPEKAGFVPYPRNSARMNEPNWPVAPVKSKLVVESITFERSVKVVVIIFAIQFFPNEKI
jgi:hypothetical protein